MNTVLGDSVYPFQNMPLPSMSVTTTPDGMSCMAVTWLWPTSELAQFLLDTLANGPFDETHHLANPHRPFTIFRASEHRYN